MKTVPNTHFFSLLENPPGDWFGGFLYQNSTDGLYLNLVLHNLFNYQMICTGDYGKNSGG